MGPSMPPDIEGRARATIQQDGLTDILLGIGLLVGAGHIAFQFFDEVRLYAMPWMVFLAFGVVLAMLRRKLTYPRVGYVRFRPSPLKFVLLAAVLLAVLGGLIVFCLGTRDGFELPASFWIWLVFGIGLAGAALGAWAGHRMRMPRFYVYSVVAALGILAPLAAGLDIRIRIILMMALPGVSMIPGGAITLRRFLRRNPLPKPEVGDVE